MKKSLLLLWIVLLAILLAGCNMTQYQNDTHHVKFSLPDDMTVYKPGDTVDEALLRQYDLTKGDLTSLFSGGCLYYAVGTKEDVQRKITLTVQESDYAKEIWQLKEGDTETINTFTDDIIEFFNTSGEQMGAESSGYQVINKGSFAQKDAYCVFVDLAPYGSNAYDSIYMATIYNGKWYAVLYNASKPITEDFEKEAHNVFDSFFITETLQPDGAPPKSKSGTQALLVVLLVAIVVALCFTIFRFLVPKREPVPEEEYVSQFEDVTELYQTKRKKDQ